MLDQFSKYVVTIRDTDSVDTFLKKVAFSKQLTVIGNGGIASEIVFKCENVHIDWIIRDDHISATFMDPGASEFFMKSITNNHKSRCKASIDKHSCTFEEETKGKNSCSRLGKIGR